MSNYDLTLHPLTNPRLPQKDVELFFYDKVWTYKTGDNLVEYQYVSPEHTNVRNMDLLKKVKRGVDLSIHTTGRPWR